VRGGVGWRAVPAAVFPAHYTSPMLWLNDLQPLPAASIALPASVPREKPFLIKHSYHPSGALKEEIHYRGRTEHGPWRAWHPNGQLAHEYVLDGGVYTNTTTRTWHLNGKLQSEGMFVNGRMIDMIVYNAKGRRRFSLSQMQRKALQKMVARAVAAKPPRRGRKPPSPDEVASQLAQIHKFLAGRVAPAREWLTAAAATSERNLGEMDAALSLEMVTHLHNLGAADVLAVEIEDIPGSEDQTSNHLLVQLPAEPETRARLFAFGRQNAKERGFDGEFDYGQEYLWMWLC
jgi:hypothetical protein